jgi:hypothetical protein
MKILVQILAMLTASNSYKVIDLTNSAGAIPIRIKDSYVVEKFYSYIHHLNISQLSEELDRLKIHKELLETSLIEDGLVDALHIKYSYIRNKLMHLVSIQNRKRRGIFNGLGTAISWITGNMDANDKERYDNAINKIQNNNYHIEHNVEAQISVNKHLLNNINEDLKLIQNNNNKLQSFINKTGVEINFLERIQHFMLLDSTLAIIESKIDDVLNSLEFCKLNTLHYSIITFDDLHQILKTAPVNLITKDLKTLWEISKVHCSLRNNFISYIIELPLETPPLETYFILSYPVDCAPNICTLVVDHPLVVKKQGKVVTLKDCIDMDSKYCNEENNVLNDDCVSEILYNKKLDNCNQISIRYVEPFVKYIHTANVHLLYNYNQTTVIRHNISSTTLPLTKIQLFHLEKNERLLESPNPTSFIQSLSFPITSIPTRIFTYNISFEKIHKTNVKLEKIENLEEYETYNSHNYTFIVICIVSLLLLFMIVFIIRRKKHKPQPIVTIVPNTVPNFSMR